METPPYGLTSPAALYRIIDGDTIVVKCRGIELTVRLLDCWAPEIKRGEAAERSRGLAAKDYLQSLLRIGDACVLHVPTGEGDRFSTLLTFGRVLGFVWKVGDVVSINEKMVAAGHATKGKEKQ